jgi:hypothetical protein
MSSVTVGVASNRNVDSTRVSEAAFFEDLPKFVRKMIKVGAMP